MFDEVIDKDCVLCNAELAEVASWKCLHVWVLCKKRIIEENCKSCNIDTAVLLKKRDWIQKIAYYFTAIVYIFIENKGNKIANL